jgi:hypothetical protein
MTEKKLEQKGAGPCDGQAASACCRGELQDITSWSLGGSGSNHVFVTGRHRCKNASGGLTLHLSRPAAAITD